VDVADHDPAAALVDSDALTVSLQFKPVDPGKVVAFDFSKITSETGALLKNAKVFYTVTRKPEPERSSLSQFLSLPNAPPESAKTGQPSKSKGSQKPNSAAGSKPPVSEAEDTEIESAKPGAGKSDEEKDPASPPAEKESTPPASAEDVP
jgi:hypothetical protein